MDNESNSDHFESIFSVLHHGKYQKRYYIVYNFISIFFVALAYCNAILAMTIPDHWCNVPQPLNSNCTILEWKNLTIPKKTFSYEGEFENCKMYNHNYSTFDGLNGFIDNKSEVIGCQNGWEYDHTWFSRTIPSQENWVCDKEIRVSNALFIASIGELFGNTIFGYLGDRFGRRFMVISTTWILFLGRIISIFTTSVYWMFAMFLFVGSFPSLTMAQGILLIGMEISDTEHRSKVPLIQNLSTSLANCMMAMIFWAYGDWKPYMLTCTIPLFIVCVLNHRYLIESPIWLLSRGKVSECSSTLKRIQIVNGKDFSEQTASFLQSQKITNKNQYHKSNNIIWKWVVIKHLILLTISSCTTTLIIGIYLYNVSNIQGNPYMNYIYQTVMEIPGHFAGEYFSNRIGRRWARLGFLTISALSSVFMMFLIDGNGLFFLMAVALGKFSVNASYYPLTCQMVEMLPTGVRNTGNSISSVVGMILWATLPYVVYLGRQLDSRIPYIFCIINAIVGGIVSAFCPETLHCNLPETLEDLETLGSRHTFWKLPKREYYD